MTRTLLSKLQELDKAKQEWALIYGKSAPYPENLILADEIAEELYSVLNGSNYAKLLVIPENLKALREVLCVSEHKIGESEQFAHLQRHISSLIAQIDVFRPLNSAGKHNNLHTSTCGCADKGLE